MSSLLSVDPAAAVDAELEEKKSSPPPSTQQWPQQQPNQQLYQPATSQPTSNAALPVPPPVPSRPTTPPRAASSALPAVTVAVTGGDSPQSASFFYDYNAPSLASPTASFPQQQLLTATGTGGAGVSYRSSSSSDGGAGQPSMTPMHRRAESDTVNVSDTATSSDFTFASVAASDTTLFATPSTGYRYYSRPGAGRRTSNTPSTGSAVSVSPAGSALPAGANRFTPMKFDDKGHLICEVLPISSAQIAFGLWAYNLALCTAALCVFFGPFSILWYLYDTSPLYSDTLSLAAGIYAICLGPLIVLEERVGLPVGFLGSFFDTAVSRYTIRSVGYVVLSSLLYLSWPTVIPAISLCIVGIVNRMASALGEKFEFRGGRQPLPMRRAASNKGKGKDADDNDMRESFCQRVYLKILPLLVIAKTIRDTNRVGIVIWMALYVGGNVVLFIMSLLSWIDKVKTTKQNFAIGVIGHNQVLSYWLAPAKAWGVLLDLNCALILLPVCRTVIRWLYERSTVDQRCTTRLLRFVLRLVPLDFALHAHALIGGVILLAAVGHTLAHFVNFALAETVTLTLLSGPWPLISGGLLIGVMLLMYSSTSRRLRFAKFELFFETHHLFIVFFVLLLVHGAHGKGPNFWKYFVGPAALYVLERLLRIYRGRLPVKVLSAQFMQDVMCLEFDKTGVFAKPYRTGQYVHLQCPAVSPLQWHPFTISSAPSDPTVTLHIKISTDKPSSFTYRVAAYMTSMGRVAPPLPPESVTVNVALGGDDDEYGCGHNGDGLPMPMPDEPMMADSSAPAVAAPAKQRPTAAGYEYVCVELDRPDRVRPSIRKPGRYSGPDGRPLFRIDGPHAAPAQHLAEYDVSLVVGAGIGCTPLSSCLRQVVQYDWKTNSPQHSYRPSVVYFVLSIRHDEIQSFRWLIQLIRETQQKVDELRKEGRMANRHIEVHIYVTSPPKDKTQQEDDAAAILEDKAQQQRKASASSPKPTPLHVPHLKSLNTSTAAGVGDGVSLTLDDYLLAHLMANPSLKSDDKAAAWSPMPLAIDASPASSPASSPAPGTAPAPAPAPAAAATAASAALPAGSHAIAVNLTPPPPPPRPTAPARAVSHRLADVHVYSDRTPFAQIFAALSSRHAGKRVGVMFCGKPIIANDLRQQCKVQNGKRGGGARFHLHAENF